MTDFIELFKQEAERIEKTYYNPNIPSNSGSGITASEMKRRFESVTGITERLEKDLVDAANNLIRHHNVPVTDELKEQLKNISLLSLRRVVKANTTGLD